MGANASARTITPEDAKAARQERMVSLDEGDARGKAFTQCVKELDPETAPQAEEFEYLSRRKSKLSCGPREDPGMARDFGRVLQDMVRQLQSKPTTLKMRIFDNRVIPFDIEGGQLAYLEECRCTQFRRLRAAAGLSETDYYQSMCGSPFRGGTIEKSGKSGSLFLRTHDERFVLKTVQLHEFEALQDILPNYVLYLEENSSSLLCRFFAAYSLTVDDVTLRLVVMENVLRRKAERVYDLKGTTEDRWVEPATQGVLKDNNFAHCSIVLEHSLRKRLVQCIRDDAEFLESLGLMDYSLLVGITPLDLLENGAAGDGDLKCVRGQLSDTGGTTSKMAAYGFQLGVIDYLQRWTPKKVAAHWLKKPTLGCCHEIDTEPPAIYCARFYKYLNGKVVAAGAR